MNFEFNLSLVLSHTILLEHKKEISEPWGQKFYLLGGDPPSPTSAESTASMLQGYQSNLPGFAKVANAEILPNELAQLQASQAVSPAYAQLAQQLYGQYGPSMNKIGNDIASQNAMSQANSDLAIYKGPGRDIAAQALDIAKINDPEYYATRANLSGKLNEALSGGLTGGENEALQRGAMQQNQNTGQGAATSTANTAANAMRFGGAERDRMTQALGLATNALPALKSGVDTGMQTIGRPTTTNTGDSRLGGAQQGMGNQSSTLSNNLLGQVGENQRTAMGINANRRDTLDRVNSTMESQSKTLGNLSGAASSCCFIFLQSYNGVLPEHVRICRDALQTPLSTKGYRAISKYLVPLMARHKLVTKLVNNLMVSPITSYGEYLVGARNSYKLLHKLCYRTWFSIWTFTGKVS